MIKDQVEATKSISKISLYQLMLSTKRTFEKSRLHQLREGASRTLPKPHCHLDQKCYQLPMSFSFEKLTVYQKALDWVDHCEDLVEESSRKVTPSQRNQLSRAAMSIALNIAEANGRWHKAEKRNFFWIARGSVFECAALLQILKRRNKITSTEYDGFFAALEEMAKMLSGLIKSVENLQAS